MSTAAIARGDARSRTRSKAFREFQKVLTIVLFLVPAFIFFLLFIIWPLLQSVYYSLFDWKGFGPAVDMVWFQNYGKILADPMFSGAILNGFIIVVLSLALQLPLSLGLALLVRRAFPGRMVFRTIFFMPYVFSEVITGVIWSFLFQPDPSRGLINALLTLIPGVKPLEWLGDSNLVLWCIFIALSWKYFGFHMLLYMAGLSGVDREIEEAAIVDGANRFQTLFMVTIPLISSTIRTSVYISVLGALQQFGLVWIMSKGGPFGASEMMATYMYRTGFIKVALAKGCAVAVIIMLICLTFSVLYQYIFRNQEAQGGIYL